MRRMMERNPETVTDQRRWRSLPERIKRVWLLRSVFTDTAVILICAVLAIIFIAADWWGFWQTLVLGLVAAWAVAELATQPLQTRYAYAFTRFSIGQRDLKLHTGWLFRKSVTVPFNRVQHVDTKQGPLLRAFGMTSISVHTAVGEHEIEAIEDAEAAQLVDLITARVLAVKEDL